MGAERCGWNGSKLSLGEDLGAIFQASITGGPLIRVSFSSEDPMLPVAASPKLQGRSSERDDSFYPDKVWPDDRAFEALVAAAGRPSCQQQPIGKAPILAVPGRLSRTR